jgi:hypothetical protein
MCVLVRVCVCVRVYLDATTKPCSLLFVHLFDVFVSSSSVTKCTNLCPRPTTYNSLSLSLLGLA